MEKEYHKSTIIASHNRICHPERSEVVSLSVITYTPDQLTSLDFYTTLAAGWMAGKPYRFFWPGVFACHNPFLRGLTATERVKPSGFLGT
jgi:hypothetical protein